MTTHTFQASEASTLLHYLHVLRRRKWLILQAVVIVPLAALLLSLHQHRLYQASAEVLLTRLSVSSIVAGTTDPNLYQSPERLADTAAEVARTPQVAVRAVQAAHVTNRTAADLLTNSSVAGHATADILEFRVTDRVPVIAARLATSYARAFTTYRFQLDTQQLAQAQKDLNTQIKQLELLGDRKSANYISLVQKRQLVQLLKTLQTKQIVIRTAGGSATQIQPRPVRNAVLGLFLGLVVGIGLAFLRDALDTRLRSAEEITDRLGLPLLARLPPPPPRLRSEGKLAMLEDPGSVNAEAFRVLRTNLEFVNLERGAQIIMVTSALEAEGKSTTVANLGVALARGGRRVIIVDLDLRRPLIDRLFRLGKCPGLTQVVIGQLALEEALVPIPIADSSGPGVVGASLVNGNNGASQGLLEILPAGPLPPDVGEFVGSRNLSQIFEQLRAMADVILVDSPPLLRVGDAITLSGKVDGLLIAVNLGTTRRPVLNELRRVLDNSPAATLGFILTGADVSSYGYGYGGYYSKPRTEAEREVVA